MNENEERLFMFFLFFQIFFFNCVFAILNVYAVNPPKGHPAHQPVAAQGSSNNPNHNNQNQPADNSHALLTILAATESENKKLKEKVAELKKRLAEYEPGAEG